MKTFMSWDQMLYSFIQYIRKAISAVLKAHEAVTMLKLSGADRSSDGIPSRNPAMP